LGSDRPGGVGVTEAGRDGGCADLGTTGVGRYGRSMAGYGAGGCWRWRSAASAVGLTTRRWNICGRSWPSPRRFP